MHSLQIYWSTSYSLCSQRREVSHGEGVERRELMASFVIWISYGSPSGIQNPLADKLPVGPNSSYSVQEVIEDQQRCCAWHRLAWLNWLDSASCAIVSVSNSLTKDFPSHGLYQYLNSYINSPALASASTPYNLGIH